MTTKHMVMDINGHSTIEFDPADAAAVGKAERRFRDLVGRGAYRAARSGVDGRHELVRKFDPADDLLFFPHLVGG